MANPRYFEAKQTAFEDIPAISMAEVGTADGFRAFAEQLVKTARDVGFFYLLDHGIDQGLRDRAFAASARFFALPEAQKATVAVNQMQRGWMGQGMSRLEGSKTFDAKEVFFWGYEVDKDDGDVLAGVPLVAPNQWPDDAAPWLRAEIMPYYTAVLALSQTVLSAIAMGLGQKPDFFVPYYDKPLGRGQLVYYPPSRDRDFAEERLGAAAHTDFGVLTMLAQDMLGGLQVRNADGNWIEAPPVKNSLVCNIGDLLAHWTGGQLTSTLHRVINRASEPRFSIPIFCDPRSTAVVDPADFGMPEAGTPITAGEHIVARNKRNFAQYKA